MPASSAHPLWSNAWFAASPAFSATESNPSPSHFHSLQPSAPIHLPQASQPRSNPIPSHPFHSHPLSFGRTAEMHPSSQLAWCSALFTTSRRLAASSLLSTFWSCVCVVCWISHPGFLPRRSKWVSNEPTLLHIVRTLPTPSLRSTCGLLSPAFQLTRPLRRPPAHTPPPPLHTSFLGLVFRRLVLSILVTVPTPVSRWFGCHVPLLTLPPTPRMSVSISGRAQEAWVYVSGDTYRG